MKAKSSAQAGPAPPLNGGLLERQCECGQHTIAGGVCAACAGKGASACDGRIPPSVYEVLRTPGEPLSLATLAYMEPRFGGDFSSIPARVSTAPPQPVRIGRVDDPLESAAERMARRALNYEPAPGDRPADLSSVRVHTGPLAERAARDVKARAFTTGNHVVFSAAEYRPGGGEGRRLLTHELAHVLQQSAEPRTLRRTPAPAASVEDPVATPPSAPPDKSELPGEAQEVADAKKPNAPSQNGTPPGPPAAAAADPQKAVADAGAEALAAQPEQDAEKAKEAEAAAEKVPKGIPDLATGDLAVIDEELAEHQRWGAAAATVGTAESTQRAEFIAQAAAEGGARGFVEGAKSGAIMGAGMKVGEKLIEKGALKLAARVGAQSAKFTPLPAVGAVVGGVMSAIDLAERDWGATGEAVGRFGQGSSPYEVLANSIEAVSTVIEIASAILNVVAGVIGAISIAMWAITIATVGIASPLAATLSAIAAGIGLATLALDAVNALALKPMVTVFRSLHAFTSDADPRDIVHQGAAISQAAGAATGFVGGFAGGALAGAAIDKGGKLLGPKKPSTPVSPHPTPPAAGGEGPRLKALPPEKLPPTTTPPAAEAPGPQPSGKHPPGGSEVKAQAEAPKPAAAEVPKPPAEKPPTPAPREPVKAEAPKQPVPPEPAAPIGKTPDPAPSPSAVPDPPAPKKTGPELPPEAAPKPSVPADAAPKRNAEPANASEPAKAPESPASPEPAKAAADAPEAKAASEVATKPAESKAGTATPAAKKGAPKKVPPQQAATGQKPGGGGGRGGKKGGRPPGGSSNKPRKLSKRELERLKKKADQSYLSEAEIQALADHAGVPPEVIKQGLTKRALRQVGDHPEVQVPPELHQIPEQKNPQMRKGEKMPGRPEVSQRVKASQRRIARERYGKEMQAFLNGEHPGNAMLHETFKYLTPKEIATIQKTGKLPRRFEFHHLLTVADFPEYAHMGSEVGTGIPHDVHVEKGHGGDPTAPIEAATYRGTESPGYVIEEGGRTKKADVAEGKSAYSEKAGGLDRDIRTQYEQRVKQLEAKVKRLQEATKKNPAAKQLENLKRAQKELADAQQLAQIAKDATSKASSNSTAPSPKGPPQGSAPTGDSAVSNPEPVPAPTSGEPAAATRKPVEEGSAPAAGTEPKAAAPDTVLAPEAAAAPSPVDAAPESRASAPQPTPLPEPVATPQPEAAAQPEPAPQPEPEPKPEPVAQTAAAEPPAAPATAPENTGAAEGEAGAAVQATPEGPEAGATSQPVAPAPGAKPSTPKPTPAGNSGEGGLSLPSEWGLGASAGSAAAAKANQGPKKEPESAFQRNVNKFKALRSGPMTTGESVAYMALGPVSGFATIEAKRGFEKARQEPVVERVNPNYPEPPCTPQDIVDIQNQILQALDARAKTEAAAAAMAKEEKHHQDNEKPLTDAQAGAEKSISATEAHQQAVERRNEANEKKKEEEKKAKEKSGKFATETSKLTTVTVPMAAFERFTSLAYSLPNSPGILVRAKNGILKMNRDSRNFLAKILGIETTMNEQKAGQAGRDQAIAADGATITATGDNASQSKSDFEAAKGAAEDLDKTNKSKLDEAVKGKNDANSASSKLDAEVQQKKATAQDLNAKLQAWAQAHQQARVDALDARQKALEKQGYKIMERQEK